MAVVVAVNFAELFMECTSNKLTSVLRRKLESRKGWWAGCSEAGLDSEFRNAPLRGAAAEGCRSGWLGSRRAPGALIDMNGAAPFRHGFVVVAGEGVHG